MHRPDTDRRLRPSCIACGGRWTSAVLALALVAVGAGCADRSEASTERSVGVEQAATTTTEPARDASAVTTTTARPATPQPSTTVPATTALAPSTAAAPPTVAGPARLAVAPTPATLQPAFTGPVEIATATGGPVAAFATPLVTPDPAAATWTFPATTNFGNPTTFLVTAKAGDWYQVLLPMRPNGTQGWLHRTQVSLAVTTKRIVVDRANRSVAVFDGATPIAQTSVVVGKSSTPTPEGTFFVTDLLQTDDPYGVYGPYIIALSARSDAFDFWNGQEPLVALHGTNQPGLIGTAASNGCIRLPNEVATQLVTLLPLGTPVYIV